MTNKERSIEEIYKQVRSNSRAILYSDLIGLGVENERKQCGRDDMWAITTEELELLTQTLQTERQKREGVVEALTKEHYGISYESDTCIECENHNRIEEALAIITQTNNK